MTVRLKDDHNVYMRTGRLAQKRRGKLKVPWDVLGPHWLKPCLLILVSAGQRQRPLGSIPEVSSDTSTLSLAPRPPKRSL